MRISARRVLALGALALLVGLSPALAQGVKTEYERIVAREELLRADTDAQKGTPTPLLHRMRSLASDYEALARRHPRSGYSDNAVYRGAVLLADAFWDSGEESDRRASLRLFSALGERFPKSSLNAQVPKYTTRLQAAKPAAVAERSATATEGRLSTLLKEIRREPLPDGFRVTLELERETPFREERLEGPPRVFIDLQNTRVPAELRDATLGFPEGLVRQIRVGRQLRGATRVVLDLRDTARHSVYTLYNPYRVVVDIEKPGSPPAATLVAAAREPAAREPAVREPEKTPEPRKDEPGATWTPAPTPVAAATAGTATSVAPAAPTPGTPAANRAGGFSLSRQLGLGISRVVIDAGHGGHDPGARVKGLNEADVTLDVALRLEKLLLDVPGVEVVMTRRTDVFIPLEERTAIANRTGADLFLSIHVNASPAPRARGIETYFLNFAPNPEAEAIAARENATSSKTMHDLPDIVKAIALNNKIDESRDFARMVQDAMFQRVRRANADVRNLGVKQAPFVVLIGATMPSVLAEISFITNRQEAALLKTTGYRQALAEALFQGISKYQRSLKAGQSVAAQ
jgi:N-acetylmuramoyl-L-alanine amidase